MDTEISDTITIGGVQYAHVKTRTYTPVSVFKNATEFLRIGPTDIVAPELALHKKLLMYGFPVPKILGEGQHEGKLYYRERSLGDKLLGDVFQKDCQKDGMISAEHFDNLMELSKTFAQAQLKTAIADEPSAESFYYGVNINYLLEELSDETVMITEAFQKVRERTAALPSVLTHGDFNAFNFFADGVIDFGNAHNAPAGYDIVNNIYHPYNFPDSGDYEIIQGYHFTPTQIDDYFFAMGALYTAANLPPVSSFRDDFIVAKAMWAATRMQRYPKLQQWRYDRLKIIMKQYVANQPIIDTVLHYQS